jgi:hypothetical protein
VSLFSTLQQFPVDLTVRQENNLLIQPRLNPNMELPPSQYADQPLRVQSIVPQFVPFLNDIQQSVTQRASVEQVLSVPTVPDVPVIRPALSILPVPVPLPPPVINSPSVTQASLLPVVPSVALVENVIGLSPASVSGSVNTSSTPAVNTAEPRRSSRGQPLLPSHPIRVSLRSNKGVPYVSKGAYISTPVCNIQANSCILPPCSGYVVGSSPIVPVVKRRHRFYSAG